MFLILMEVNSFWCHCFPRLWKRTIGFEWVVNFWHVRRVLWLLMLLVSPFTTDILCRIRPHQTIQSQIWKKHTSSCDTWCVIHLLSILSQLITNYLHQEPSLAWQSLNFMKCELVPSASNAWITGRQGVSICWTWLEEGLSHD
jgi:hypothetical protein